MYWPKRNNAACCSSEPGFREHFVDALIVESDDVTDCLGIEVITDEYTDLIAPHFPCRLAATAQVGIVNDIVV